MHRVMRAVLAVLVGGVAVAAAAPLAHGAVNDPGRSEQREVFSPNGQISRTTVHRPVQPLAAPAQVKADVVPIQQTGPSDQRFDLVFVGDGFTSADLATYHQEVLAKWAELSSVEPFKTYQQSFNVWQVNVVSNQSGVDNDPTLGVARDTALDMGFWCQGNDPNTERLLCLNESKANQFAALAPAVDQVIALGNTAKYGGAGGGVATAAGGNDQAGQIAVHELGHSIGKLADEYDYPNDTYTGDEVPEANVSIHNADQINQGKLKWVKWMGQQSPDGGVVGAYEGARYYVHGIYRPTDNSIMRTLGREYNLPGREALAEAITAKTATFAGSPAQAQPLAGPRQITLGIPAGGPNRVRWSLDGRELPTWNDRVSVDVGELVLHGRHTLSVQVADISGFVRDADFYRQHLTAARSWTVTG